MAGGRGIGEVGLALTLTDGANGSRGMALSPDGERLAWVSQPMSENVETVMVTVVVNGETVAVLETGEGRDYGRGAVVA